MYKDMRYFDYVRARVGTFDAKHPWIQMSNEEILHSAKMYHRDEQSGEEGYTLAAALVFGTADVLKEICPHYKTEALCRKEDILRYDDRDTIDCNLLQAYERLMAFVRKHLPDRFYLEGDTRVSLRDVIFREAAPTYSFIGNLAMITGLHLPSIKIRQSPKTGQFPIRWDASHPPI